MKVVRHRWSAANAALALYAVLFALCFPAEAQQPKKVPRVGYVFSFTPAEGQHLWEACREGLRELGYVEGQNIILEPRWAEGRYERHHDLVADLVRLNVDVMVVAATPANFVTKATTHTIPIVFVAVADPVRVGLVASFARPGGNFTGLSLLTPELSGNRLELLMEALHKVSRIAVLRNPGNPSNAVFLEETQVAAGRLGIQLQPLEGRNPDEIEQAFEAATRERARVVFDDPVIYSYRTHGSSIVAVPGGQGGQVTRRKRALLKLVSSRNI